MKRIDFAALMYRHLPAVWRERDNAQTQGGAQLDGDLHGLLAVYGELLDALYRTARQRYYDTFPDFDDDVADEEGQRRGCQPWVLPYIARLLDVTPLSPLESGRRAEVAQAVSWRQRKGTLGVSEDIAEQVGGLEVELREGWQMLAVSARPGMALLPPTSFGEAAAIVAGPQTDPRAWLAPLHARHPGLPNGTLDLRACSRAVRSAVDDPTRQRTRFADIALPAGATPAQIEAARADARTRGVLWRQMQRHGTPCFPGSYQDVSAHTVDLRTPDWRRGHAHPRRVVLNCAPFEGLFPADEVTIDASTLDAALSASLPLPPVLPLQLQSVDGEVVLRPAAEGQRVRVSGAILHGGSDAWRLIDLDLDTRPADITCEGCRFVDEASAPFDGDLQHAPWASVQAAMLALHALPSAHPVRIILRAGGQAILERRQADVPVRITGAAALMLDRQWQLNGLWFADSLWHHAGTLQLERCAVLALGSSRDAGVAPALDARSCLFGSVNVAAGLLRMEYCTALDDCIALALQASDCIFLRMPLKDASDPLMPLPERGCVRYSRLPALPEDDGTPQVSLARATCTTATPIFLADTFGESGCGVLHPATASAVRHGAEDGGEMGAHHEDHYTLREQAVLDKLADFLPFGQSPVLAPDPSMRCAPPAAV